MRSSFKKLFVIGIMLVLFSSVKAQDISEKYPDYVITMQGDSLACTISGPYYQTPEMKESKRIKPDEVKEYGEKNKDGEIIVYQSVYAPDKTKPEFMALYEKGKINVYLYSQSSGLVVALTLRASFKWYISKGSNKVSELNSTNLGTISFYSQSKDERKRDFGEMIKDNKEVYDKYMAKKKFSLNFTRSLIHQYNTGEWITNWYDYDNK